MLRLFFSFGLVAVMAGLTCAGTPATQPVSGTVGADCEPPWIFVLELRDMPNGAGRAYLRYHDAGNDPDYFKPPLHEALRFNGRVYATEEQHLNAPYRDATVTFDTFTDKVATGTYVVTLRDGSTQTGSFRVKRLRLGKLSVCS